ncbi:hypothetical protein [Brevibacillus parabrevis]|mgnify:CR=1 FL=1|jgi:hypothetical protein|uniref:hypothetical protein n=1 Tax=Brevibacillus parabrevis TaxID=54914 RepID=UPI0024908C2B|nr:hypothetical protein [Brevibacillus parabrevis]
MSLALQLWQDDTLHAELESIMLQHISLAKEFSDKTTTSERRQAIMKEIEQLRQQREIFIKPINET